MPRPPTGGWGYVSAKDSGGFDEGSTTITQVQGLRGCRNAGIPVPKEIIEKAVNYIHGCTGPDGGVQYNQTTPRRAAAHHRRGHRLPVQRRRLRRQVRAQAVGVLPPGTWTTFRKQQLRPLALLPLLLFPGALPRRGQDLGDYRDKVTAHLLQEQNQEGYWDQGFMGPVYTTAMNLTILQLERGVLPIYQR